MVRIVLSANSLQAAVQSDTVGNIPKDDSLSDRLANKLVSSVVHAVRRRSVAGT